MAVPWGRAAGDTAKEKKRGVATEAGVGEQGHEGEEAATAVTGADEELVVLQVLMARIDPEIGRGEPAGVLM